MNLDPITLSKSQAIIIAILLIVGLFAAPLVVAAGGFGVLVGFAFGKELIKVV